MGDCKRREAESKAGGKKIVLRRRMPYSKARRTVPPTRAGRAAEGTGKPKERPMNRDPRRPSPPERLPVLVDDCPCTQVRCHRHGNCVECIRVHRTRREHIPECLQDMFRDGIRELARLVEYDIRDARRTPAYWDERLGKEIPASLPGKRKTAATKSPGTRRPPGRN